MSIALFTYGSLEFEEIMGVLTGRALAACAAVLEGYRCRLLRGEVYPGIVADRDADTQGTLYEGLDSAALEILDAFEGAPYLRRRVVVRTRAEETVSAFAYVVPERSAFLLSSARWDEAAFRRDHYASLLDSCRHLRAEFNGSSQDRG